MHPTYGMHTNDPAHDSWVSHTESDPVMAVRYTGNSEAAPWLATPTCEHRSEAKAVQHRSMRAADAGDGCTHNTTMYDLNGTFYRQRLPVSLRGLSKVSIKYEPDEKHDTTISIDYQPTSQDDLETDPVSEEHNDQFHCLKEPTRTPSCINSPEGGPTYWFKLQQSELKS